MPCGSSKFISCSCSFMFNPKSVCPKLIFKDLRSAKSFDSGTDFRTNSHDKKNHFSEHFLTPQSSTRPLSKMYRGVALDYPKPIDLDHSLIWHFLLLPCYKILVTVNLRIFILQIGRPYILLRSSGPYRSF